VLETQFRRYVRDAQRERGVTGEALLQHLERRLDNVVFRSGFAASRSAARQVVRHRHFVVNGQVVDIPSYSVREGDVIEVRAKSRPKKPFAAAKELGSGAQVPGWLETDWSQYRIAVKGIPTREQIDSDVNEALIVEYYAR
jgi:small subunit ribosomal protein S4